MITIKSQYNITGYIDDSEISFSINPLNNLRLKSQYNIIGYIDDSEISFSIKPISNTLFNYYSISNYNISRQINYYIISNYNITR